MIDVETRCPWCGTICVVPVPEEGYKAWRGGALIQRAFPTLSADDRERLVSGICPPCWKNAFAEPEDEEDADGN